MSDIALYINLTKIQTANGSHKREAQPLSEKKILQRRKVPLAHGDRCIKNLLFIRRPRKVYTEEREKTLFIETLAHWEINAVNTFSMPTKVSLGACLFSGFIVGRPGGATGQSTSLNSVELPFSGTLNPFDSLGFLCLPFLVTFFNSTFSSLSSSSSYSSSKQFFPFSSLHTTHTNRLFVHPNFFFFYNNLNSC